MSKIREHLPLVLGLLFLAGLAWAGWIAFSLFLKALTEADPKIVAAIIGASTTILVAVAAVLYTQNQIKLRDIDEAHRAKKVELYSGFLTMARRQMAGAKAGKPGKRLKENELTDFMLTFKTEVILWSSPAVINAYSAFENTSIDNTDIGKLLAAVDVLYRAMRSDIGLSNRGLPPNQLMKMYLKDPSELDDALTKAASQ